MPEGQPENVINKNQGNMAPNILTQLKEASNILTQLKHKKGPQIQSYEDNGDH